VGGVVTIVGFWVVRGREQKKQRRRERERSNDRPMEGGGPLKKGRVIGPHLCDEGARPSSGATSAGKGEEGGPVRKKRIPSGK